MRALRCPRCHRESGDPLAAFCRACGAPLRLAEEPASPPLSSPVAIDRRAEDLVAPDRAAGRVAPPPPAAPRARPPPDDLADVERSVWDLGPLLPMPPEPAPGPAPVPPPPRAAPAPAARPPSAPALAPRPPPASAPAPRPPAPAIERVRSSPVPPAVEIIHPPARPPTPAPRAPTPPPPARDGGEAVATPGVVEVHVRRAAPWRRAAAWAIDALPFAAGAAALGRWSLRAAGSAATDRLDLLDLVARERAIVLSVAAVAVVALGVYATLAHALAGATLGKLALGLRVIGPDGERPGLARSAIRSALALASGAALGLGFLLALFAPRGRAFHDLVARTWVVEG